MSSPRGVPTIDLLAPARAVTDTTPGGGGPQRIALRLGRLPVGAVHLPVDAGGTLPPQLFRRALETGPVTSAIGIALARHLLESGVTDVGLDAALDAARTPRVPGRLPGLTVAVCTRDRPAQLNRLLGALLQRTDVATPILVVDNAPTANAARDLAAPGGDRVRFVHEPGPGLDRARNTALRTAETMLVAFLDDDTVPDPGWERSIRRAFAEAPEAACVAGLVEPLHADTPGAIALEAYGGLGRGYARRWGEPRPRPPRALLYSSGLTSRLGAGANLAVRRDVALAIGGFDPALDAGTPTRAGGDLEFIFRLLKAGHAACYDPAAVVRHEHRATLEDATSQVEGWGTGLGAYLARTAAAYPEERTAARLLLAWLGVSWYGRRALASLFAPSVPRMLLRADMRGILRGGSRYAETVVDGNDPAAPRVAPHHAPDSALTTPLDVEMLRDSIETGPAAWLDAGICLGGRTLGRVRLPAVRGIVGIARLRDAIATRFRRELLRATDAEAADVVASLSS